jgi:thiol-disulfide isomerase/thioredoxin
VSRPKQYLLFTVIAVLAGVMGYGGYAWHTAGAPDPAAVLRLQLPALDGTVHSPAEWRGRIVIVNFWATWCAPCRDEIPHFIKLQAQHAGQVQFVGIAIDDAAKSKAYADELGMNYPVLVGGVSALDTMRSAGNRAGVLPYTLIYDRDGGLLDSRIGAYTHETLAAVLALALPTAR